MSEAVARNDLVGVRFTPKEQELLDALLGHFEDRNPGMKFTKQMVIRAAVFAYAKSLGIESPSTAPPSKPASQPRIRAAARTAKKR